MQFFVTCPTVEPGCTSLLKNLTTQTVSSLNAVFFFKRTDERLSAKLLAQVRPYGSHCNPVSQNNCAWQLWVENKLLKRLYHAVRTFANSTSASNLLGSKKCGTHSWVSSWVNTLEQKSTNPNLTAADHLLSVYGVINIWFLPKPNIFLSALAVQNAWPARNSSERVWQSRSNLWGELAQRFADHAVFNKPFCPLCYFLYFFLKVDFSASYCPKF